MRIIAGSRRGRTIEAPRGLNTRPTLDRVREAVFGILQFSLQDQLVLDLFAGSGAMGLEALSRGAAHAVFCDKSRESAAIVRQNIEKLGFSEQALLYECEFRQAIRLSAAKGLHFDVVFLDPPYDEGLLQPALQALLEDDLLQPGSLIAAEHRDEKDPELPPGLRLKTRKHYGEVGVSILEAE